MDGSPLPLTPRGIAQSHVSSNTHTEAFLGNSVIVGSALSPSGALGIGAVSTDDNFAFTNAGSGGAIAGAAAMANTTNRSHTTAAVGAFDNIHVAGDFILGADHTAQYNEHITTFAGGLLAGAGASINHEVTADTTAEVGTHASVSGGTVNISAADHAVKPQLAGGIANLDGTTGGLASAAGVDETATITFHTDVNIDDHANIVVPGPATNNDVFVVTALNTGGQSDPSAEASATPVSAPDPPTGRKIAAPLWTGVQGSGRPAAVSCRLRLGNTGGTSPPTPGQPRRIEVVRVRRARTTRKGAPT